MVPFSKLLEAYDKCWVIGSNIAFGVDLRMPNKRRVSAREVESLCQPFHCKAHLDHESVSQLQDDKRDQSSKIKITPITIYK